ncbi:ARM repeat-containing protein [Westerdykella ornata]|uniref:ARM repeat-containing protein n=1 Tax=Westerdykella ornata TaxID=318751 RepID=A0A6A6J6W7_WESOR|nr:ARM repeat-containing protein [Westerdykella ornata]KAF2272321.1 ARM repeat-containing protein [Westerdykella ornata]
MADASQQPSQSYPLHLEAIVNLVRTLYDPGTAKKVAETEATLNVLQRSPQGWEIADALLSSHDENVRFFGALTFTVKINTDSEALSEDDSRQLLQKLIYHLITRPSLSISTRKLCSTLALYFCKPVSVWEECVPSLALSFCRNGPIVDTALGDNAPLFDIVSGLPDEQLLILLDFAMNLADEAKRLSTLSNRPDRKPHERMIANVESIEALLQVSFLRGIKYLSGRDASIQIGGKIANASLKCFTGWIFYAQSEFAAVPEKLQHLRSVTHLALQCLEYNVDDAMELIAEIVENYPNFLEPSDQELLWSVVTSNWGMEILANADEDTVALARIIVAYGHNLLESKKLYKEPDNAHHQQVMTVLHELLKYPESVGVEDEVAPVALDFWSNYVSTIAEVAFEYSEGQERPDWLLKAMNNVSVLVSELVRKIIFPLTAVDKTWDEDAKKTFKVFRVDVRDILQDVFDILQGALLDNFLAFAIQALEARNWREVEAGLFCLVSIADLLTKQADTSLRHLFDQPLFTLMSTDTTIPTVTRRAAVDTVAAFDGFFLRHPVYLPQVLPFLLSALAQPSLAHGAAKSFASLCSECSKSLTGELESFFQMYQQFLSYPTANEFTKSRVLEGIAAIVQAQESDEKRLAGLQRLFQYITHDAMQAVNVTKKDNDAEQGLVLTLTTLRCLHSVGKATQASDEEVIDLETDKTTSGFWTQGPGKEIQNQIINFVNYLTQMFPAEGEVVEAACNVFRVGFKESVPGPYVLPPSATIDFVLKTTLETPRLPHVLETACCWVSSHKRDKGEEYEEQCQRLLHYVLGILQVLQHPRNDPEISVGCIELIQKFVNTSPQIFAAEPPKVLKGMFDFAIECIMSPEVLPKRAASQLWKDVFDLSANTKSPYQSTGQDIVDHFGSSVVSALVYNLCGEVDFTSLEYIVVPLRKCINSNRHARAYITQALAEQPLILRAKDDPNLEGTMRKFIEGMMRNAKAATAFKETVKAFWDHCKVLQMQFNPRTIHPGHRFAHGIS